MYCSASVRYVTSLSSCGAAFIAVHRVLVAVLACLLVFLYMSLSCDCGCTRSALILVIVITSECHLVCVRYFHIPGTSRFDNCSSLFYKRYARWRARAPQFYPRPWLASIPVHFNRTPNFRAYLTLITWRYQNRGFWNRVVKNCSWTLATGENKAILSLGFAPWQRLDGLTICRKAVIWKESGTIQWGLMLLNGVKRCEFEFVM